MAATARVGVLLLVAACGGGEHGAKSDTTGMAGTPAAEQPATVARPRPIPPWHPSRAGAGENPPPRPRPAGHRQGLEDVRPGHRQEGRGQAGR